MKLELTPSQARVLWWLLVLAIAVRVATLGAYPLFDPSESRYAEMARKMLETGNWLVPQYDYGTPFWGKPPLAFWLSALSMLVFGVNEFGARAPSLLLMGGCGVLVHYVARIHAGRDAALLCAVVFTTTVLVFVGAGAVVTDTSLTFGTTLSMAGFWLAAEGPASSRRAWGYAFFIGLAVGMLAKGPIAVVLTLFPIGLWVLWQRQWRSLWERLPWIIGFVLTAALVTPWYWAAERASPGFLEYFLVGEHWMRFTVPGWTGDHYGVAHMWKRGWIWLFWFAGALPWSLVAIDWMVRAIKAPRDVVHTKLSDPAFAYLLFWASAPMLFFTLSRNVLITYVLPGLPAFALLIGVFGPATEGAVRTIDRAEKRAIAVAFALVLAAAAVLLTQQARIDRDFAQRALVRAYEAQRSAPGQRLVYLGDQPASAAFYSEGRAVVVTGNDVITPWFTNAEADFFAMRDDDHARLTEAQRARLLPLARYGKFQLYREVEPPTSPETRQPG